MTTSSYRIVYKGTAAKGLRRLGASTQRRLLQAIESLAADPRPSGVKKLKANQYLYRIRVGDCHIVYEINDGELQAFVLRLAHRKDIYQK